VILQVENISGSSDRDADIVFTQYKKMLTQKVGIQLDITGLRADQPYTGRFDDYFVLPSLVQEQKEINKELIVIEEKNDCISEFSNIRCLSIVIGAPGSGKSTWTKWLQREVLKSDKGIIAIRVEFRELNENELPSTYEIIRKSVSHQLTEDLSSSRIKKWFTSFRIVFILDGFDEIKPVNRGKFLDWITEIKEFTTGCPIIITSRPITTNHLKSLKGNWNYWHIRSFNKERVIKYITQWYANFPLLLNSDRDVNSKDIAREWSKDPTIGPLTGNPLLLSTLLMVHHLDGKLPSGRANLYKRYVDGMLGLWDERHKVTATNIQLTSNEKRKILRGIAIKLFFSEIETIEENELIVWLAEFLQTNNINESAIDVLSVLRERTGLIIGPGIYNFVHKTIVEFLVAETLYEGVHNDAEGKRIDRFRLLNHLGDDSWNVVIFLWAGLSPAIDVTSFIEHSINNNDLAIGFGILLDQYDRISVKDRKRMFQKIKNLDCFLPTNIYFGVPGWPTFYTHAYGIPTGGLRSISSDGFHDLISSLLERAIIDNTISWKDFDLDKNDFGWLIIILFSTLPSDDWETVIKIYKTWNESKDGELINELQIEKGGKNQISPFRKDILSTLQMSEDEWGYFIAGRMTYWWYEYQTKIPEIARYCYTFIKLFPQFSGFISLHLISSFFGRESIFRPGVLSQKDFSKYFEIIAKLILNDNFKNLNKKFLKETKNWELSRQVSKVDRDLLVMFQSKLQSFSDNNLLINSDTLEIMMELIDKLIQLRLQSENNQ